MYKHLMQITFIFLSFTFALLLSSCQPTEAQSHATEPAMAPKVETPEYFQLRPELEKAFGYSHAVKIGNHIKISGAVSMDEAGNPTAVGDIAQQMKNCYEDLRKVLAHYGCTFDDVVVENIFTTNMPLFLENAAYRGQIYTKHFPTGTWAGVKELAFPEFMVEIEMEAYKSE